VITYIDKIGRLLTSNIQYLVRALLMIYLSIRATILAQHHSLRTIIGVVSAQIYFVTIQAVKKNRIQMTSIWLIITDKKVKLVPTELRRANSNFN
jgi:hypothetical protein